MSERERSFVTLLESIADNKFVLGDRLVEVGVSGPNLEATLAAIAIAQGELGHARHLYNWSFAIQGKQEEVREQTGKALPLLQQIHDWFSLIAGVYTFNVATEIVLTRILRTGQPDVTTKLAKMMRELKEHITFSRGWSVKMLNETGLIPERYRAQLEKAADAVGGWLRELENADLEVSGAKVEVGDMAHEFSEQVARVMMAASVSG